MSIIQMNVPLVFWGQRPPTHEITCVCRSEEKKGVATASRSGQICLWDVCRERDTEKVRVSSLSTSSVLAPIQLLDDILDVDQSYKPLM